MSDVSWGNYAEAYKALHGKLDEILTKLDFPADPAVQDIIDRVERLLGHVEVDNFPSTITRTTDPIDKIDFTYNADGNVETVKFCVGASVKFTLTFGYDANKKLTSITRS